MKLFYHYKDKPYRYLDIVKHSETLEDLVLYRCRYENPSGALWVRPKKMFFEEIEVQGKALPRFREIPLQIEKHFTLTDSLLKELKLLNEILFGSWDEKGFHDRLKNHSSFLLLGARVQGKLIGFKLGYARDRSEFYSWIGGVHPEYRGVGIAQDLMRSQHEWCRDQGFQKISTKSQNRFKEMLLLNLREGFEISGFERSSATGSKILLEKVLVS